MSKLVELRVVRLSLFHSVIVDEKKVFEKLLLLTLTKGILFSFLGADHRVVLFYIFFNLHAYIFDSILFMVVFSLFSVFSICLFIYLFILLCLTHC